MCGGTTTNGDGPTPRRGLSPRVRGNLGEPDDAVPRDGSIPACAGEPGTQEFPTGPGWVYPRVCGGTVDAAALNRSLDGLSPRVRGNLYAFTRVGIPLGSIPACAGEPSHTSTRSSETGVYPRVCGEPPESHVEGRERRVYPRVCGGTGLTVRQEHPPTGLSPRVRGNLSIQAFADTVGGSIPACAGEPRPASPNAAHRRVYPRVCGGTSSSSLSASTSVGLSPRVRGNL